MSAITLVAFPTAPVGKEQELLERFEELVPATRAEPGCLAFIAHRHPTITNRFVVYEKFKDQAAFDAHLEYPHTKKFVEWVQSSGATLNFEFWNELAG
ncbi:putative quinol monooxygenase [Paraburkholderia tropica]|uniref:putative quinol monooxygenase n=1 Tax=Paraburkholderia tropica TaxID=92647 RepID=UPI0007ECA9A4|nr:putative quinol monooxygenase [Paraburkholderia tropica]OBR53153.1 hypothetical protein A6456_09325 [Paraburkholderia tropica]